MAVKISKYLETCVCQFRCLYKHTHFKERSVSIEIDETYKKALDLKADIATLKDENYRKVNFLVKVHLKEMDDLRKENLVLDKKW